jgi:hypothetical protein
LPGKQGHLPDKQACLSANYAHLAKRQPSEKKTIGKKSVMVRGHLKSLGSTRPCLSSLRSDRQLGHVEPADFKFLPAGPSQTTFNYYSPSKDMLSEKLKKKISQILGSKKSGVYLNAACMKVSGRCLRSCL